MDPETGLTECIECGDCFGNDYHYRLNGIGPVCGRCLEEDYDQPFDFGEEDEEC